MSLPIALVTGALGAGKTTLLNALLRLPEMAATAVVVNEFGAAGIDHRLVRAASEDVVLLPGGCLCCEVRTDLVDALLRLERGARRGELPPFRRAVIETSGLAEPGPTLQLFVESPALHGRFALEVLVAVIDGRLGLEALADERSPALRQALLADRLVVSKIEMAADLGALDARLAEINPHAERIHAARGAAQARWLSRPRSSAPRKNSQVLRAKHDDSIESFVLRWERAQPMAAMGEWLHRLAEAYAPRLLRVKGIVAVEDAAQPVAVHVVQGMVSPPELVGGEPGASEVVFITRGLEPGDVWPPWPAVASAR